jgi:ribosomal protein S18 acetylase RimI-like enzyme
MAGEEIRIRTAAVEDAEALARMLNALSIQEGFGGDLYAPDSVRAQFFGTRPVLQVLVAEGESGLIGYAAFEGVFNTDIAEPGLWLHDIYVAEAARGQGLGRRLMSAVARAALAEGRTSVWWGVRNSNTKALAFYDRLGAHDDDARILELDGTVLTSLAQAAEE